MVDLLTTAADVSVAQVARRYAMNANMIFKRLGDPRYAPDHKAVEYLVDDTPCFLPVEIVDRAQKNDLTSMPDPKLATASGSVGTVSRTNTAPSTSTTQPSFAFGEQPPQSHHVQWAHTSRYNCPAGSLP